MSRASCWPWIGCPDVSVSPPGQLHRVQIHSGDAGVEDGNVGHVQLQGKVKTSLTPGMEGVWEDMLERASVQKT